MESKMEIFALKDAFWKLTARVAVIENIITEKFGSTAFSEVHDQLPMTNCSSCKNTMGQSLVQSQVNCHNPDVSKSKSKSGTISAAASKRKSSAASNTQSSPGTKKRRRVSRRINYKEDGEDSAGEGTSSDIPELLDKLESPTIKIEDEEADKDYNPNEDDDFPDLSPVSNHNEDESSKPPQQSQSVKVEKDIPKPKLKLDFQKKNSLGDAKKKFATLFTNKEKVPLKFIKSAKGNPILVDNDNFTYSKHKKTQSGIITWKCTKYWTLKCKGTVRTMDGFLGAGLPHNHVENEEEPKYRELRNAIVEAAKTSSDSAATIIESVFKDESNMAVKSRLPNIRSMGSLVRRQRRAECTATSNELSDSNELQSSNISEEDSMKRFGKPGRSEVVENPLRINPFWSDNIERLKSEVNPDKYE